MKKEFKLFVIIVMLFISSACTAEYTLTIDENNNFVEETTIFSNDVDESLRITNFEKPVNISVNGDVIEGNQKLEYENYYNIKKFSENNLNNLNITYTFDKNNFKEAMSINYCFDDISFNEIDGFVTLLTSAGFNCIDRYNLANMKITINAKNMVENNADFVNNNSYTWIFNSTNQADKRIKFKFNLNKLKGNDKETINSDISTKENKKTNNKIDYKLMIIISLSVLIMLLIILNIIMNKGRKNNKI